MSDLISRQVAISAICSACGKIDCDKMDKCEKLQLPPANNSEIPNSSDTISRQAAIDRATKEHDFFRGAVTVSDKARRDELLNVICWLGELPPTQPERIIHCKDCKHHWTHKCMDSMPIERCDLGQTFYDAEVDYCSLAERREVTT